MKNVFVDFSKNEGQIKPVHGVNNGPKSYGFQIDTSEYFKKAGFPFSRLHDTEYPYGGGNFVDVDCIFKDFNADVNDPNSYDFILTDEYLKAIKECGAEIIYRLGSSIENAAGEDRVPARHIIPPKDYLKWAKICEHIIMHYNEGWADGFNMNIQYWAIWNEPESRAMWQGTREEFYKLYNTSTKHLKARFPDIKIGGFGAIGFYEYTRIDKCVFNEEPYISLLDYIRGFLTSAKKEGAPVDFFDYHIYTDNVEELLIHSEIAKKTVAECGFPDAELILDEWNTASTKGVATCRNACMAAAALVNLQKSPVDIATYYDASIKLMSYNGFFEYIDGELKLRPTFYAFEMFNEIYKLGMQVNTKAQKDIFALAAGKDNEGGIFVSNYENGEEAIAVHIKGFESDLAKKAEIYILDESRKNERIRTETITGNVFTIYIKLKENSVLYIKLNK